jgi:hypothetical protein
VELSLGSGEGFGEVSKLFVAGRSHWEPEAPDYNLPDDGPSRPVECYDSRSASGDQAGEHMQSEELSEAEHEQLRRWKWHRKMVKELSRCIWCAGCRMVNIVQGNSTYARFVATSRCLLVDQNPTEPVMRHRRSSDGIEISSWLLC